MEKPGTRKKASWLGLPVDASLMAILPQAWHRCRNSSSLVDFRQRMKREFA
jgi:hypothetical protein